MIAGLGEISDGGIRIDGRRENRVARKDRDVAMVFGSHALRPHLDVAESIAFGLRDRRTPEAVIGAQAQEVAGVPGLADDPEREPAHPSDGRRPRVATGRAIVRRREAFLPDAPPRRAACSAFSTTRATTATSTSPTPTSAASRWSFPRRSTSARRRPEPDRKGHPMNIQTKTAAATDGKLAGKTAIVTGGGRDIGLAAARRLASEGAAVAINYFSSGAGAEAAAEQIAGQGGRAFAMQGDLTDPAAVEALVARTAEELGGVDVLVNNAGGLIARKTVAEMPLEHWRAVMDLNLTSTFLMVKACLAHMKAGAIVNLASQAGRDGGGAGAVAYATSKGAVMTMTRGLAKELGPAIRVNALCPGMIDTDFHNVHTPDAARRGLEATAPMRRQGTVEDTANLVLFLACEDSAFITGANVDINGGMLFS